VEDELEREGDPFLLGDDLHQILLDLDWIGLFG
jgi:hypothetical protein